MAAKKEEKAFSLEEAFEKLEETVELLETEDITLEDSFKAYQTGMALVKQCNDTIEAVEKKVQVINEAGELDEF